MFGTLYIDGKKLMDVDDELPEVDFTLVDNDEVDEVKSIRSISTECSGSINLTICNQKLIAVLMSKQSKVALRKLFNNNWRRMHSLPLIRKGCKLWWLRRYIRKYGYHG